MWLQPFFTDLGRLVADQLEEPRANSFLLQHVAVEVQWGNAVAILGALSQIICIVLSICWLALPQFTVTVYCHSLLSQFTVTVYCHSLLSQFTVTVYCHSLLSQFTVTVYCHSLLSQFTAKVYCHGLLSEFTVTTLLEFCLSFFYFAFKIDCFN